MKFRIVEFRNGKFGLQVFKHSEWKTVNKELQDDFFHRFDSKSAAMDAIDNYFVKETLEEIEF